MSNTAIFIGAGASKAFGFPLTNELLPLIKKHLEAGRIFGTNKRAKQDGADLAEYLNALLPGFNLPDLELPLITDVLSLIDHALSVSNLPLPRKAPPDLIRFRTLLERAIFEVLDWPYKNYDVPRNLVQLVDWLMFKKKDDAHSVGVISTNYDIAIETELFKRHAPQSIKTDFDFGFSWRDPFKDALYKRPTGPCFRLYKLHGSLNWLRCDLCEHIYINVRGVIAHRAFDEKITNYNTCHCGHALLRSVLVAPSLVRDIRDGNLLEIWKNALELLRTAPEWIIIGYSFPPEDIAIRSLFVRAYQARSAPPRIRVIQKGDNKTILSRYRLFFPECSYETEGLEGFISSLSRND
jgi:hypothetical protein